MGGGEGYVGADVQVESNQGSAGHSITLIYEPSGSSAPGGAGKGQGRVERGQGRRPGLPCAGAGGVGADTSRGDGYAG